MLHSLQWHYDPLYGELWHQEQRVRNLYTLSLDCHDETSWMNWCLLKAPKYFPLSFLTIYRFFPCRKQTTLQQKAALLQRVQRDCLLPCLLTHWEDRTRHRDSLSFVTSIPKIVYISSALNLRGKIRCPVSHLFQDINPFTELLGFLPLFLAPEKIKKFTSKQSEFEDRNRMGC